MPDNLPTGNNHRVSNAILRTEMTHLRTDLDSFRDEWREWCRAHDGKHNAADLERRNMDHRITKNETTLKTTTGILGTIQALAFGVSTWLGTRF